MSPPEPQQREKTEMREAPEIKLLHLLIPVRDHLVLVALEGRAMAEWINTSSTGSGSFLQSELFFLHHGLLPE